MRLSSEIMKAEYETFMRITPCKECSGRRLKKSSLAVTVCDKNIYEVTSLSINKLYEFLDGMELTPQQQLIGKRILKEIKARVGFLKSVGLEYLVSVQSHGYPYPAVRHSESVWLHRLVRDLWAYAIFWMSPVSDCIRGIMTSCWGH